MGPTDRNWRHRLKQAAAKFQFYCCICHLPPYFRLFKRLGSPTSRHVSWYNNRIWNGWLDNWWVEKNRTDDVTEFSKLYKDCVKMAEDAEEPVSKPRVVGRQTLRSNVEAQNLKEYFQRSTFLPFLDHLICQLEDRYSGRSQDAIKTLYLLPKNLGK